MEAEQSSYYREYPVALGQKREVVGVSQSDTANNTLCGYCFQVHPFLAKKAPGTPVFGHCPFFNVVEVSECFWTVPGQSGAEPPIFICP